MPRLNRNITIVSSVLLLHVLVLWAMQTGLLRRVAEAVVPAEILVEIMAVPAATPAAEPAPQPQPKAQAKSPTPQPVQPTPAPTATPQPSPVPLAIAPTAAAPAATETAPTTVAATPTPASAGKDTNVQPIPSLTPRKPKNGDCTHEHRPRYPGLSERLGETGISIVEVQFGTNELPANVKVSKTSKFLRLDSAAVDAAWKWRCTPGIYVIDFRFEPPN